jgi:hypothetical protein
MALAAAVLFSRVIPSLATPWATSLFRSHRLFSEYVCHFVLTVVT